MKISTHTGDNGLTDIKYQRIHKSSSCIELLGLIDECMALIILFTSQFSEYEAPMKQHVQLFSSCSAFISRYIEDDTWAKEALHKIESEIETMERKLTHFEFIFPFHHKQAAELNLIRTKIRIIEHHLWKEKNVPEPILCLINRLSDWYYLKEIELIKQK